MNSTTSLKTTKQPSILHIDADAFFVSCEQALNPKYKGKAVVTGQERGIVSALSYEAKKRGITRGLPIALVKRMYKDVVILPGNYETYSLFSKRMFMIMRRYSAAVEEYGIDEGFIDLSQKYKNLRMSDLGIAKHIQKTIEKELGITVSVGIAPTKVLAKVASKYNKPQGFTHMTAKNTPDILKTLDVGNIWGVGYHTAVYMKSLGITTAADFMNKSFGYVQNFFTKPHQEIWKELHGERMYSVVTEQKTRYASISKMRTFSKPTKKKEEVYTNLLKNVENACLKARKHNLYAKKITVLLKGQDFSVTALEACLTRASAFPPDMTAIAKLLFKTLHKDGKEYRATGVVLSELQDHTQVQTTMFEQPVTLDKMRHIYTAVDTLAQKFGKHTVRIGGSLTSRTSPQKGAWKRLLDRKGDWGGKRLSLPLLSGMVK